MGLRCVLNATTYQDMSQHRADSQLCGHLLCELLLCFGGRNIAPFVVHGS